jgi:RNA polymerase sigma-70 factor (ECF subfamily)
MDIKDNQILKKIIAGCLKNKPQFQQKLHKALYPILMPICLRYGSDYDEAQDILQEGFIKLFKSLEKYEFKGSFEGWVKRIFVNNSIDYIRKKKQYSISLDETNEYLIADNVEEIEDNDFVKIKAQEILLALQKLSPVYRMTFNMYVLEGMTHKEIAQRLGISEGTSKSNLSRARKKIKEILLKK